MATHGKNVIGIVLVGIWAPITASLLDVPSAGSYYASYYAPAETSYQLYPGSPSYVGRAVNPYSNYFNTAALSGTPDVASSYRKPKYNSQRNEEPSTTPEDVTPKPGFLNKMKDLFLKGVRIPARLLAPLRNRFQKKLNAARASEKKRNKFVELGKQMMSSFANRFRRPNKAQRSAGDLKGSPKTEKKPNKLVTFGKKLVSSIRSKFNRSKPQNSSGDLKEATTKPGSA